MAADRHRSADSYHGRHHEGAGRLEAEPLGEAVYDLLQQRLRGMDKIQRRTPFGSQGKTGSERSSLYVEPARDSRERKRECTTFQHRDL